MFKQILFLLLITTWISCGDKSSDKTGKNPQKTLSVVTTIGMIADIVENVGGSRVHVTGLMGPGVDPHLYKASAGDVSKMSNADIIFYNGLHLEGKMTEIFEQMGKNIKTVAVTKGVERSKLLTPPEFEGAYDPHIWFDVSLWMTAVEQVQQALIELDSTHSNFYQTNAEKYLNRLEELHNYIQQQALKVPKNKRVLITAHDAFNYFGRAYGYEVKALQGISTAIEAGTGDVKNLAQFIVDRKIPAIFVETSVPERYIKALQAAVKAKKFEVKIGGMLFSDAMGNPGTAEETYIGMVTHNIDTIVNGLLDNEGQ